MTELTRDTARAGRSGAAGALLGDPAEASELPATPEIAEACFDVVLAV